MANAEGADAGERGDEGGIPGGKAILGVRSVAHYNLRYLTLFTSNCRSRLAHAPKYSRSAFAAG